LQSQANLLKRPEVTGTTTKIITVGIGSDISLEELKRLASPGPGNSILFQDILNKTFQLTERQLVNSVFSKIHVILNFQLALSGKSFLMDIEYFGTNLFFGITVTLISDKFICR